MDIISSAYSECGYDEFYQERIVILTIWVTVTGDAVRLWCTGDPINHADLRWHLSWQGAQCNLIIEGDIIVII